MMTRSNVRHNHVDKKINRSKMKYENEEERGGGLSL